MNKSKLYLFVENYNAYSHTFIREDHRRLGIEITPMVDLLQFRLNKNNINIHISFKAILLLIKILMKDFFGVRRMLFSSKIGSSFFHSIYMTAAIAKEINFCSDVEIRCHFLGKASFVAYSLHLLYGVKYTVVCHGSDIYDSGNLIKPILISANSIECVTIFGKGFIFGLIGDKATGKIAVRRNSVMNRDVILSKKIPLSGSMDGVFSGVLVARLVPQKNIPFALHVIREIKNKLPCGVKLEIIGGGDLLSELSELAQSLDICDSVDFVGVKPQDYIVSRMLNADCMIMPCLENSLSEADGLPVVFQEALLCGLPVYCSQAFGVFEFIINNYNGYVFRVGESPGDWADLIIKNIGKFSREDIKRLSLKQF